ncbi:MAG: hypothetical protein ACM3TR_07615 [Caulobacteraceae bacterium]
MVRTLCTNVPKSIEWLESYGMKFKIRYIQFSVLFGQGLTAILNL